MHMVNSECKTGEVRVTKGYNLPAKYIIHTVGPIYSERYKTAAEQTLYSCYRWGNLCKYSIDVEMIVEYLDFMFTFCSKCSIAEIFYVKVVNLVRSPLQFVWFQPFRRIFHRTLVLTLHCVRINNPNWSSPDEYTNFLLSFFFSSIAMAWELYRNHSSIFGQISKRNNYTLPWTTRAWNLWSASAIIFPAWYFRRKQCTVATTAWHWRQIWWTANFRSTNSHHS